MKKSLYPIITFVILQLLASASLILWIIWYAVKKSELESITNLSIYPSGALVMGILFLSFIIITSSLIFIEWLKTKMLYRHGSDFISGFTHELMTPLTCIQMNLEAAQSSMAQEKKDKLLKTAFFESKKLQRSIDKILDSKALEHRINFIHLEEISIRHFLEEYVQVATQEYPNTSLNFQYHCSENFMVKGDSTALQVVLNNLIENGIKYSPDESEIKVVLSTENKKAIIAIADQGIGMQAQTLKNVFRIFYRANTSTRGSGLGLYICKKIIKGHKGKIKAISLGKNLGSTFMIILPGKLYE